MQSHSDLDFVETQGVGVGGGGGGGGGERLSLNYELGYLWEIISSSKLWEGIDSLTEKWWA